MGKHRSFASFYKNFKKIAVSIGRPDARPHDHAAATASEWMLTDTADRMQGYYDGLAVDKPKKP